MRQGTFHQHSSCYVRVVLVPCSRCTMQCRDVNHNLLRAVGCERSFHKCIQTCCARCQFSTCVLQKEGCKKVCVYWQELRQKAFEIL